MRTVLLAFLVVFGAVLAPAPSYAQDLAAARAQITRVLTQMEGSLIAREALAMNFQDMETKATALLARTRDLAKRFQDLNAYCKGTFEHGEYVRRLAYCESMGSQLDTLKAQLNLEVAGSKAAFQTFEARSLEQAQAHVALEAALGDAYSRLIGACAATAPAERAGHCGPLKTGPRAAKLVVELNKTLENLFSP